MQANAQRYDQKWPCCRPFRSCWLRHCWLRHHQKWPCCPEHSCRTIPSRIRSFLISLFGHPHSSRFENSTIRLYGSALTIKAQQPRGDHSRVWPLCESRDPSRRDHRSPVLGVSLCCRLFPPFVHPSPFLQQAVRRRVSASDQRPARARPASPPRVSRPAPQCRGGKRALMARRCERRVAP